MKIVANKVHRLCFCHLKLSGQIQYIGLTISEKDAKALEDDPRFSNIDLKKICRFTKIPISSAEDVKQYVDIIRLAYIWGTTIGVQTTPSKEAVPTLRGNKEKYHYCTENEVKIDIETAVLKTQENPYEFINTKIVGVTFKNGRKSRQTILRRLHWKDEPFDKNEAEVILDREEFEGKPAYAVLLNGEKAGYIPAELAQYIADNSKRCDGVTHIETYCTHDIYGAEIIIRFRKVG